MMAMIKNSKEMKVRRIRKREKAKRRAEEEEEEETTTRNTQNRDLKIRKREWEKLSMGKR